MRSATTVMNLRRIISAEGVRDGMTDHPSASSAARRIPLGSLQRSMRPSMLL